MHLKHHHNYVYALLYYYYYYHHFIIIIIMLAESLKLNGGTEGPELASPLLRVVGLLPFGIYCVWMLVRAL